MGQCKAKEKPDCRQKAAASKPAAPGKVLNPEDYVISKKTEEVNVRSEGSIDGQQFNIEECVDCDIFLMDNIATSFVDECERCRIFIGPVETSIMIRNCRSCDFVVACQQFRARDCLDCRFSIFCSTEPVIETSTNLLFSCFDFNYFSLRQQLERSKLQPWNNKWWMIYDFNKKPNRVNWGFLSQEESAKLLKTELVESFSEDERTMDPAVPLTWGSRPKPFEDSCFVIFLPGSDQYIEAFLSRAHQKEDWILARTRSMALPPDRLKSLFAWTKEAKLASQCKGKDVVGIDLCGPSIHAQVEEVLYSTGMASGSKLCRLVPKEETPLLTKAFFEAWKDEI